jgi:hypothetical protein
MLIQTLQNGLYENQMTKTKNFGPKVRLLAFERNSVQVHNAIRPKWLHRNAGYIDNPIKRQSTDFDFNVMALCTIGVEYGFDVRHNAVR